MTQTTDDRPARFVAALERLDRGPLAGLRRGLGGDERGVYWLEGLYARTGYGEAKPHEKEALQLAAGLYALNPAREDSGEEGDALDAVAAAKKADEAPTIGGLMGRLHRRQNVDAGRRPDEGSSTEKRFLALLDVDRDGLPYHMRQAITLLVAKGEVPNWLKLTRDLLRWHQGLAQRDRLRRIWAQDFYREISWDANGKEERTEAASAGPDDVTPTTTPTPRPLSQQGDDADGDLL